jgi:SAM-dependent methyltransferase
MSLRDQLIRAKLDLKRQSAIRSPLPVSDAATIADRLAALGENVGLLDRITVAVRARLRGVPPPDPFASLLARHPAGWSFDQMLPYFHVDWSGPREPMRDMVAGNVSAYANDRDVAVVVGCGAGALVGDLAERFGVVYGIDLSISALLLARRLLDGERMRAYLETARWRPVELCGRGRVAENAQLIAGDAARLPLADASAQLVVTEYLLDIVPDPGAVISEVNRVLEIGGLWINQGLPFPLPDRSRFLGRITGDEMPALLARFGFDGVEIERRSRVHLDVQAIDPWAHATIHKVLHAVARKTTALEPAADREALAGYFGDRSPAVLAMVPLLAGGVTLTYQLAEGEQLPSRLRVGRFDYDTIDAETRARFLALLGAIDGKRPVQDVALAQTAGPRPLAEREVILALDALARAGALSLQ